MSYMENAAINCKFYIIVVIPFNQFLNLQCGQVALSQLCIHFGSSK